MPLNKKQVANVREWIDALRNGQYKQGKGGLLMLADQENKPGRFCCLGVACNEFMIRHPRLGKWEHSKLSPGKRVPFAERNFSDAAVLPPRIMSDLGLSSRSGYINYRWFRSLPVKVRGRSNPLKPVDLAHLNDMGVKFPRIATIIEAALEADLEKPGTSGLFID